MINFLEQSFTPALMITGFVFMMMMLVEYLNVLSKGLFHKELHGSRLKQYLLASFLGATPGCLGAFAAVTLYSHGVFSLGAVVAAMVATSGDEAFVMLSMIPEKVLLIFFILFMLGIFTGFLTDLFLGDKAIRRTECQQKFELHEEDVCHCFPWGHIKEQWAHCSLARGVLSVTLVLFLFGILSGKLGPPTWSWIRITLFLVSGVALFIVSTVPEHFLEKHVWEHIAKVHVTKIFFWTFAALFLMHIIIDQLHLEGWIQQNQLIVLAIACMVGLIPESGPHLIFLTLFSQNALPFSILLANSVVQDGHGMLPMLAESRLDFFKIKGINFFVGLCVGLTGFLTGW
ncbi:MAG: arsenic efflux protein [Deltaproteobacteria bacterium]|nr:arsenic efflux protein [Deltaproteobacteria bacterium]